MRGLISRRKFLQSVSGVLLTAYCAALPLPASADDYLGDEVVPNVVHFVDKSNSGPFSMRSWYGASLRLTTIQRFGPYYFDGNNVGIEMTASCPTNGNFFVSLERASTGGNVGTATFRRNGFTKATWTNVGSGDYIFTCSKNKDGSAVASSDVAMYSW